MDLAIQILKLLTALVGLAAAVVGTLPKVRSQRRKSARGRKRLR